MTKRTQKKVYELPEKHTENDTEKPFNYALLQVIKSAGADGKVKTEVNIVPVKGFYLFRKPSVMPMKSLDLIDDDFELKMQAGLATRVVGHAALFWFELSMGWVRIIMI